MLGAGTALTQFTTLPQSAPDKLFLTPRQVCRYGVVAPVDDLFLFGRGFGTASAGSEAASCCDVASVPIASYAMTTRNRCSVAKDRAGEPVLSAQAPARVRDRGRWHARASCRVERNRSERVSMSGGARPSCLRLR
jgi:hypothetical protein